MLRSFALLTIVFAGCSVGEVPIGGGPGLDDGGISALCATRLATPSTAHLHTDDGTTKAGQGCIVAGCHLTGGLGPTYTLAGTLYKLDGTTPSAGAEIRFAPDAGGGALTAKTDTAGNFFSSAPMTIPGTTAASACPATDHPMVGKIVKAADGNCNGGVACHQNPGGTIMILADM